MFPLLSTIPMFERRQTEFADPLEDLEEVQGEKVPGPMHDRAEKPTKPAGKTRSGPKEAYHRKHGK